MSDDTPKQPQKMTFQRMAELGLISDFSKNAGKMRALGGVMARQQAEAAAQHQKWLDQMTAASDAAWETKRREKQEELDWRAGLLEQQRLTVDTLTVMNAAQRSDRRLTWWLIAIACAALIVAIATAWITAAK